MNYLSFWLSFNEEKIYLLFAHCDLLNAFSELMSFLAVVAMEDRLLLIHLFFFFLSKDAWTKVESVAGFQNLTQKIVTFYSLKISPKLVTNSSPKKVKILVNH